MQPRQNNPIAQRKKAVRNASRNVVAGVGGGLVGGAVLGLLMSRWEIFFICLVGGLVFAGVNAFRVKKIINHVDTD